MGRKPWWLQYKRAKRDALKESSEEEFNKFVSPRDVEAKQLVELQRGTFDVPASWSQYVTGMIGGENQLNLRVVCVNMTFKSNEKSLNDALKKIDGEFVDMVVNSSGIATVAYILYVPAEEVKK